MLLVVVGPCAVPVLLGAVVGAVLVRPCNVFTSTHFRHRLVTAACSRARQLCCCVADAAVRANKVLQLPPPSPPKDWPEGASVLPSDPGSIPAGNMAPLAFASCATITAMMTAMMMRGRRRRRRRIMMMMMPSCRPFSVGLSRQMECSWNRQVRFIAGHGNQGGPGSDRPADEAMVQRVIQMIVRHVTCLPRDAPEHTGSSPHTQYDDHHHVLSTTMRTSTDSAWQQAGKGRERERAAGRRLCKALLNGAEERQRVRESRCRPTGCLNTARRSRHSGECLRL
jgi:hypothetical protein